MLNELPRQTAAQQSVHLTCGSINWAKRNALLDDKERKSYAR